MKLSKWAKKQGLTYKTAWNMFNKKLIPNSRQLESGTIVVDEDQEREDKLEKVLLEVISLLK